MTHDLLVQLAAQRQTQLAQRAEWVRRTAPTRPAPVTGRRTAAQRPLSVLVALLGRA